MDTLELQAYYTSILAEQYGLTHALSKYGIETRMDVARATIENVWPVIVDLPNAKDGTRCVQITPTVTTNILNCAIGGDANYHLHTGYGATAQTGTLVNGICAVAIAHLVGGTLVSINPFGFIESLPVGISAIITLKLPRTMKSKAKIRMEGFRADTGKPLFKPADIIMVEIPT